MNRRIDGFGDWGVEAGWVPAGDLYDPGYTTDCVSERELGRVIVRSVTCILVF